MPQLEGSGRPETLQTCALGVETTVSRLMTPLPPPTPAPSLGLEVHASGTQEDPCVPEVPVMEIKPKEKATE